VNPSTNLSASIQRCALAVEATALMKHIELLKTWN
jgi:hypothetical protein